MYYQRDAQVKGRPMLHEGVKLSQFIFKEHPKLRDKLDMVVADLRDEGFKVSRSDVMRALVVTHIDHATDITREYLGADSEYS